MLELKEIIDNVMALPSDKKAYLTEILIKDITIQKMEPAVIHMTRTYGEYIGKIEMSNDFNAPLPDNFWLGEQNETAS